MSSKRLTRRRFVAAGAAVAAASLAGQARGAAARRLLTELQVWNNSVPYTGDRALLTTLSPGGLRKRDAAIVQFRLARPARVELRAVSRNAPGRALATAEGSSAAVGTVTVAAESRLLVAGLHELVWKPPAGLAPGTYTLQVIATDLHGKRALFGESSPAKPTRSRAPVVRLLGLDAAFSERSYVAGDQATLVVSADARTLQVQLFNSGSELGPTYANNELNGVAVADPVTVDWSANADEPSTIPLTLGNLPSGVYYAQLQSDDGRLGFAPFIVRPAQPVTRIAVVMPTNTWQAYNFYDVNGDGFGDSWYVSWAIDSVDVTRPHLRRGVPYRYRSYDLSFLHWLARTGKQVDFYADDDIEAYPSGDALRAAYDLVVFPGHSEYIAEPAYNVVERFRDLGGNLLFLSANNFFRRVDRIDSRLKLVGLWRDLGRPEAALIGTQYLASDRGTHQSSFVVTADGAASFAFPETGLAAEGKIFGRYGIEIDAATADSPPGTLILAQIPNALGPGRTAQMTYYETPAGARVFAAGVLNFGGEILLWPETTQLLENVWAQLAQP